MKTYIQFYTMSTGYIEGTIPPKFGKPVAIEAAGDRGIIRVDGRLSQVKIAAIALQECKVRGFVGYKILKGVSLLDARPVSQFWPVRGRITER